MTSPPLVVQGYSDRVNHALAFAAKHHDQLVRKGTRAPYLTEPANVAIILTRYGQAEPLVIAGILRKVVEDWVGDGLSRDMIDQRLGDKFGADVLEIILSVTPRRVDDDGLEFTAEERRDDRLTRLGAAGTASYWVCAAETLHGAASLVTDLRRTVDPSTVWARFTGGREGTVRWYRRASDRLASLGFDAPIMRELGAVVTELETLSRDAQPVP